MAERQKQSKVITVLIIILGVMAGYMFYSQSSTDSATSSIIGGLEGEQGSPGGSIERFRTMKFNFSILQDQDFGSLRVLGEKNIDPGDTGRDNVFAPAF